MPLLKTGVSEIEFLILSNVSKIDLAPDLMLLRSGLIEDLRSEVLTLVDLI